MKKIVKIIGSLSLTLMMTCSLSACNSSGGGGEADKSVSTNSSSVDASNSVTQNEDKITVIKAQKLSNKSINVTFSGNCDGFDFNSVSLVGFQNNWRILKSSTETLKYTSKVVSTGENTVVEYTLDKDFNYEKEVPVVKEKTYTQAQIDDIVLQASNMVTWQIPNNGGWYKDYDTHKAKAHVDGQPYIPSGGWSVGGKPVGTIDNNATYSEMAVIAEAYAITKDNKFKDSFLKGIEFLTRLQGVNGGFSQCYPKRGNYSDYITLNDGAMTNVMFVLHDIIIKQYPYNTDILTDEQTKIIQSMYDKGIDFLLKSQIKLKDGTVTAWCAQHDPVTYQPKMARAFELASISGSESIGAIRLLALENKTETRSAAEKALKWFDSVKLENTGFNNKSTKIIDGKIAYFYPEQGRNTWYRFYSLDDGTGFFSDRDSKVYYDIAQISQERREGYSWAGKWPQKMLDFYSYYGVYTNGISVQLRDTEKTNSSIAVVG